MEVIADILTYYTVYEDLLQDLTGYFHVPLKMLFSRIDVVLCVLKPNSEGSD